ncbi:hypothetical protein AOLI_G00229380 [Acnodon oligacanthus]
MTMERCPGFSEAPPLSHAFRHSASLRRHGNISARRSVAKTVKKNSYKDSHGLSSMSNISRSTFNPATVM